MQSIIIKKCHFWTMLLINISNPSTLCCIGTTRQWGDDRLTRWPPSWPTLDLRSTSPWLTHTGPVSISPAQNLKNSWPGAIDATKLVLLKCSHLLCFGLLWFEPIWMCGFYNIFLGIKSMKKRSLKRWKPSTYFTKQEPLKWETQFSTTLLAGNGFNTHCIFKEIDQIIVTGMLVYPNTILLQLLRNCCW